MKRVLWGILLVLSLSGAAVCAAGAGGMTRDDAVGDFAKANFAYKDGHYQEAIDLYEQILAGGLESGPLYYNLANGYFKAGQLGRAILNYERARRLMPRDADLRVNEQFAQAQRERNYRLPRTPFWQRMIQQTTGSLTSNEMVLLIAALIGLCAILSLVALYRAWPFRRRILPLLLGVAVVVISLSVVVVIRESRAARSGVVISSVAAQFEPRAGATTHFTIKEGERVLVLKKEGPWVKVRRADGKVGWIPAESFAAL